MPHEKKEQILSAGEMKHYYSKGRTAFHDDDGSRLTLPQFLQACLSFEKEISGSTPVAIDFSRRLSELTPEKITEIFGRIPEGVMTPVAVRFTIEYLLTARESILESIDG